MKEKIHKFLNKDVKEFNVLTLVIPSVLFLCLIGIISYKYTKDSYALFTDTVEGEQTLSLHYRPSTYQKTFTQKDEAQEYVAPRTGYYYIEMAGAAGGNRPQLSRGAKTSGYIYLAKNEHLYFYVGKQGSGANKNCGTSGYEFNGGGLAMPASNGKCGPAGGGATDVRLVNGNWDDMSSLISRIMVAGGGAGGTGAISVHGAGGTLYGDTPMYTGTTITNANQGKPGTQISGGAAPTQHADATSNGTAGSFGKAGYGGAGPSTASYGGSGGGGGYYGGSGSSGGPASSILNGGGGSSYISGYAGVNSVEESTTITHTNQTKHYSGKYFVGAEMIANQNSGDGYANIEYVESKPVRKNTALNNVRYIKDCTNYNTINAGNHWIEIQAIKDGVNIAKGKTVTGTAAEHATNVYSRITDGDITYSVYANPATQAENQCVTVDLEATYDLDEVALWNYFGDQRRYNKNIVSVSSDNSTWTEISRAVDSREFWRETSNGARWNAYIDHINGIVIGSTTISLWLDGYANNGGTRNTTTTTWKNLVYNSSNTTYDGAILSGTTASASWGSNYLTLDGTDDWVRLTAMNYAKPTIEAVVSPTKVHTGEAYIVGNCESGGYALSVQNNNTLRAFYYLGGGYRVFSHEEATAANTIISVATSYDQTTGKLYKQGNLVSSSDTYNGAIGTPANSTVMAIGANPGGTSAQGSYFQGNIYSVRIYNGVLTPEQIYHNYLYDKQLFGLE